MIFVISGPSGSGKTTLRDNLLQDGAFKGRLVKSVSLTTRTPRSGERQGRDYCFVSNAEFAKQKRAKKILEWTRYLGYYYATAKEYLKRQISRGKNVVLCVDANGVRAVKRLYPESSVSIFVAPPSLAALKHRITGRCHKTTCKEINQRLRLAKNELASAGKYDYRIVNRDLGRSVEQLKKIVDRHIKRK